MLWVPHDGKLPAVLFEMKTVTDETDAHARVRHAVGQLSYYDYFHAAPRLGGREIMRCAVFDTKVPTELCEYMTHARVGAVVVPVGGDTEGLNPRGLKVLGLLPAKSGGSWPAEHTRG